MSNLQNILSSFKLQDKLNPKIWITEDGGSKMNPKVRTHLLDIATEFIEFLDVNIVVSDVVMTGSLANYNWSKFSDIDLHIIADFGQFSKKELPLYKELFTLKKTVYNNKHNIKIYGYEVELYVEDENEAHFSSGIYSVLHNEWVNEPKKEKVTVDKKLIKSKTEQWMNIIDGVIENVKDEPIDEAKELLKKYKEKLKKYRTCGLEKGGEYSDENLVFKVLRRNGYIDKLYNYQDKHIDDKLSLKESNTTLGGVFKVDLENGPKNHGKRAFGNWQSDNAWDIFAPANTVVNSYTEGVVAKVRNTGKNSGKVFGTQVTVKGENGYPDIFYTHLKDVKLVAGDKVKIGDYIGVISEWVGHDNMTHVHIGLPYGKHLKELLNGSKEIFTNSTDHSGESDDIEDISKTIKPEDITKIVGGEDPLNFMDKFNIDNDEFVNILTSLLPFKK
jgi:hypothetical protein